MTLFLALLLLVNAVFSAIVWPPFWRRVKQDARAYDAGGKPTRFLTVHAWLIGIALVIAAVSAVAGVWALIA